MANIAVLLGQDFEDSEYRVPVERLKEAGHKVTVVGRRVGETVKGKQGRESAIVDASAADCQASEFDALLIPGGYSPDHLRTDESVVGFVKGFARTDRPIAAVCHGPQLLIEAGLVRDKTLTSWPSVRTDLINAGAHFRDEPVVQDGALITSRKPDDLEAFSQALIQAL